MNNAGQNKERTTVLALAAKLLIVLRVGPIPIADCAYALACLAVIGENTTCVKSIKGINPLLDIKRKLQGVFLYLCQHELVYVSEGKLFSTLDGRIFVDNAIECALPCALETKIKIAKLNTADYRSAFIRLSEEYDHAFYRTYIYKE